MSKNTLIPRRHAAGLMLGPLAALCLGAPATAAIDEDPQEKVAAAKVATKVEKARSRKHQDKEEAEALRHFKRELDEYAVFHSRLDQKLSGPDSATRQKALAAAIIEKRAKARQGDLLLVEVQPLLRRLIAEQLKGPDTQAARKAVAEGNPGHDEDSIPVVVGVNAVYPVGASRSTVPPSVLLSLPPLPECLHYRFVDRDLILVDSVAQLIVDFLPAAAPPIPAFLPAATPALPVK